AAPSEAGQMAASDYVPIFFKNRLHLMGRPQMSTCPKLSDIIFSLPRPAPQRSLRLQPADNMRATKSVGGD
ncbi:hypothetical protein, partial [Bradyrhizobium sp. 177]|uniref:hypothetical protein n=1 Tax=Bradyrhizobium sp. 177 TaxID=2782647 RepID=UPI001FF8B82F